MGLLRGVRQRIQSVLSRGRHGRREAVRRDDGNNSHAAGDPDAGPPPEAATPKQVAAAYELVQGAVADLQEAIAILQKKSGLLAAAKTVPEDGWKEAGKTIAHDGRFPAKQLCQSALEKYEQAAQLVDGMPLIEAVPEIKEGKLQEKARDMFGTAGTGGLAVAFGAAQICTAVLVGFTPAGLIKVAVKRRRIRKGASNVDEMLQIMESVCMELEQLNQRGMGGYLQHQG